MPDLERTLNPRVVAVVGDKAQSNYMWLRNMATFSGKVYSVQVDPKELPGIEALGVPNYPSLLDIPEAVDYVLCAVPRGVAPRIVADCVQKRVGGVSLFTSGFSETGTEEGIRLEQTIARIAREGGICLIGPNCMGLFNPRLGVRNNAELYSGEGGSVAFLSQSGNHCGTFCMVGGAAGFKVSKAVSYGNAAVLDSPDYLDYLAQDRETRIIGMYIEGVRDGRRFLSSLKALRGKKPMVIWKGGQTADGSRAAASHTASLALSSAIWEAAMRQFGVLTGDNLEETVDLILGLLYLKPGVGSRVGLIAATGGQSVAISDNFAKAGLRVPILSATSLEELSTFFTVIGGSYRNPLDISSNFSSVGLGVRMLNILDRDDQVDAVAMEVSAALPFRRTPQFLSELLQALADFRERSRKPFLAIVTAGTREAEAASLRLALSERKIPAYPTFQRGARALRKVVDYHRFVSSLAG